MSHWSLSYYKQKVALIIEAAPDFKPTGSELTTELNRVLDSARYLTEVEKDILWSYTSEIRNRMFNYYIVYSNGNFYWLNEEVEKFEDGSRTIKLTLTDKIY